MKITAIALGLVCLSAPAWSQSVTLADLEGSVITLSENYRLKIVRDGQVKNVANHENGSVTIGADHSVTEQWQSTSTNVRNGHTKTGPVRSGKRELDKPFQATHGDDGVWTFDNGSLVRLRVFNGGVGGLKRTISFTRDPDGLHCESAVVMAHETGVRGLTKASEIDDKPIQILEFKQVSSTCQIAKS